MILQFLFLIFIVGYLVNNIMGVTYATLTKDQPNVIVTIDKDHNIDLKGDLFGNSSWYPGKSHSGVIRINNRYNNIDINNIALKVNIEKANSEYDRDTVKTSFLKNMKLTIERGRLLAFNKIIVNDKPIKELLYEKDSNVDRGFPLHKNTKFTVNRNDSIDLKYTLSMSKEAGNELEGIVAKVPFLININENIDIDDDDDDSDDNDRDKHTDKKDVNITVTNEHWAHNCIIALLNHKIIQGYPHDEMTIEDYRKGRVKPEIYVIEAVQPDLYITRAEAAVLVGKALGLNEKDKFLTGYVDGIPTWAKGYIIATSEKKIFKGYPFKLFKASNNITREEMIAVLVRAFELKLKNDEIELTFEDRENIAQWAEELVKAGFESKVIVGYPDNTYRPQNNITRGEAFTIICKLLGYHNEHTGE